MSRRSKGEAELPVGTKFPFFMNDEQVDAELQILQREREKLMKKKRVLELRYEVERLQLEADATGPPPPPQLHRSQSQGQRRASRRHSSSDQRRPREPEKEVYNKKPSPDIERSNREPKTPPRTTPDVTPEFNNPGDTRVQRQDSRPNTSGRTEPPVSDAPVFRNPPPLDLVGMDTLRGAPPVMTPEVFSPEPQQGSGSRSTQEPVTSPQTGSSSYSKEKEEFLRRRKEMKEGQSRHGSVRSTSSSVRRLSDMYQQPRRGSVSSVRSNRDGKTSSETPASRPKEKKGRPADPVAPPRHHKDKRESETTTPKSPGQTAYFDFTKPSGSVRSRSGPPPSAGSPPPPPPPPAGNPGRLRTSSEPVRGNHVAAPEYGLNPPRSPDGAVSLADFIRQAGVKSQRK